MMVSLKVSIWWFGSKAKNETKLKPKISMQHSGVALGPSPGPRSLKFSYVCLYFQYFFSAVESRDPSPVLL